MPAGLLGLPSITTGQGSSADLSNKSSAAADATNNITSGITTGAFNVGGSQNTTWIVFAIAGAVALAFLFMRKK